MCGTWSGGKPMNCAATHKAMANASAVDPSAIVVTSPLEKRWPKSPLMAAPASGSNGMIHKCITCLAGTRRAPVSARGAPLQLQQVHAIHIQGFPGTECRNHDAQSHGPFRGRSHHHEENENVAVKRLQLRGESDERKIDAVQHQ